VLVTKRTSAAAAITIAAIVLTAGNLRIGIAQVGPVLEEIRADTGMSSTLAGLLGTIPFLCLGVFAFGGAPMMRRIGVQRTVQLSLLLIALGTVGRAATTVPALILALTLPIGIGVALLGVAMPAVVKHRFAEKGPTITGVYVAALSVGAAVAAYTSVPLSKALGGWQPALAVGAIAALPPLLLWSDRLAGGDEPTVRPAGRSRRPSTQAVLLALVFGLQSLTFSALINWIAAVYVDAGWTAEDASLTTVSLPVLSVVAALALSSLTSVRTRPWWILGSGISIAVGSAGIGIAPTTWPFDLRADASGVAELTGWMLGLGYILSSTGPAIVGALRDATGDFTVAMLTIAAVGLAAGLVAILPPLRATRREGAASSP
jgi:CP family cyanate transporter-like MFS transporter